MRALTVKPGEANSTRVEDVPEPPAARGPVLVQALAVGVCGTDLEIVSGKYGWLCLPRFDSDARNRRGRRRPLTSARILPFCKE